MASKMLSNNRRINVGNAFPEWNRQKEIFDQMQITPAQHCLVFYPEIPEGMKPLKSNRSKVLPSLFMKHLLESHSTSCAVCKGSQAGSASTTNCATGTSDESMTTDDALHSTPNGLVLKKEVLRAFTCKYCRRRFECFDQYRSHGRRHHRWLGGSKIATPAGSVKPYQHIRLTGIGTSRIRKRKRKTQKTSKSCFLCPLCDIDCRYLGQLAMHLNWMHRHKGTQPLICKICCNSFVQPVHYIHHLQSHVVAKLACPKCGKAHTKRVNLVRHLKWHRKKANKKRGMPVTSVSYVQSQLQLSDPSSASTVVATQQGTLVQPLGSGSNTPSPSPQSNVVQVSIQPQSSSDAPSVTTVTNVSLPQTSLNSQYVLLQSKAMTSLPNQNIRMQTVQIPTMHHRPLSIPRPVSFLHGYNVQFQQRMAMANVNIRPQFTLVRPAHQALMARPVSFVRGYNVQSQLRMPVRMLSSSVQPQTQPLSSASPELHPPGTGVQQTLPVIHTNPSMQSTIQQLNQQTQPCLSPGLQPPGTSLSEPAVPVLQNNPSPQSAFQQAVEQPQPSPSASPVGQPISRSVQQTVLACQISPSPQFIYELPSQLDESSSQMLSSDDTSIQQQQVMPPPQAITSLQPAPEPTTQQTQQVSLSVSPALISPATTCSVQQHTISVYQANDSSMQSIVKLPTQQTQPLPNASPVLKPGDIVQQTLPVCQTTDRPQTQQLQPLTSVSPVLLPDPSLQVTTQQSQPSPSASPVLLPPGTYIQQAKPEYQTNSSSTQSIVPTPTQQMQPLTSVSPVVMPGPSIQPTPQQTTQSQPSPSASPVLLPPGTNIQHAIPEYQTNSSSTQSIVPTPTQQTQPSSSASPVLLSPGGIIQQALPVCQNLPSTQLTQHSPVVLPTGVQQTVAMSQINPSPQSQQMQSLPSASTSATTTSVQQTIPVYETKPGLQSILQQQAQQQLQPSLSVSPATYHVQTQKNQPSTNEASSLTSSNSVQQIMPVCQTNPSVQSTFQMPEQQVQSSPRATLSTTSAQQTWPLSQTNLSPQSTLQLQTKQPLPSQSPATPAATLSTAASVQQTWPLSQQTNSNPQSMFLQQQNQPSPSVSPATLQLQTIQQPQSSSNTALSVPLSNSVHQQAMPVGQTNPGVQSTFQLQKQTQQPESSPTPAILPTTSVQQTWPLSQTNPSPQSICPQETKQIQPAVSVSYVRLPTTVVQQTMPVCQTSPSPQSTIQLQQQQPLSSQSLATLSTTSAQQTWTLSQTNSSLQTTVQHQTQQSQPSPSVSPATFLQQTQQPRPSPCISPVASSPIRVQQTMPVCQTINNQQSTIHQMAQQPANESHISIASTSNSLHRMSPSTTSPKSQSVQQPTQQTSLPARSLYQSNQSHPKTNSIPQSTPMQHAQPKPLTAAQSAAILQGFSVQSQQKIVMANRPKTIAIAQSTASFQPAAQQPQQARALPIANLQGYSVVTQRALPNTKPSPQSLRLPTHQPQPTARASPVLLRPGSRVQQVQPANAAIQVRAATQVRTATQVQAATQVRAAAQVRAATQVRVATQVRAASPVSSLQRYNIQAQQRVAIQLQTNSGLRLVQPAALQTRLSAPRSLSSSPGTNNQPRMAVPSSVSLRPQAAAVRPVSFLQGYNVQMQQRMNLPNASIRPQLTLVRPPMIRPADVRAFMMGHRPTLYRPPF